MTPILLEQMYSRMNFSLELDILFWCASVFAFFLLFRKSNLVPDTIWGFDGHCQLWRNDLVYMGQHIVVGIRWAKNHQFSRVIDIPPPHAEEVSTLSCSGS